MLQMVGTISVLKNNWSIRYLVYRKFKLEYYYNIINWIIVKIVLKLIYRFYERTLSHLSLNNNE